IKLGLDKPWYTQYFVYLKDTLTGDLGESLRTRAPVSEEIWRYLAGTLELAIFAMVIAVFIGINAGIVYAWFQNSCLDYIAMILTLDGVSMPLFWYGLMGRGAFYSELPWLPTTGRGMSRDPASPITHPNLIGKLIDGRFGQFV